MGETRGDAGRNQRLCFSILETKPFLLMTETSSTQLREPEPDVPRQSTVGLPAGSARVQRFGSTTNLFGLLRLPEVFVERGDVGMQMREQLS
jgi:hypothetical protein